MKEATGNLWTYPADYRIITTNGTIKRNGECVMGRGCAKEAMKKWPLLPKLLGNQLKLHGNRVHYFAEYKLFTFPVKHNWYEDADENLISGSVAYLECLARGDMKASTFVMPRPGCGNGHLQWDNVRPFLESLPDNVTVITF